MGKTGKTSLDTNKLRISSDLMRALCHPLRIKILEFIDKNKSVHVNKIYNSMKLEQSITSQHLRVLRACELVLTDRDGKYIHYTVNYDKLEHLLQCTDNFLSKEPK